MIGEVDHCGLVGGCVVLNFEGIVVGEGVGHVCSERAGVAFVAVGADVREMNTLRRLGGFDVPNHFVKTLQPTVEVVGAVVGGKGVGVCVEFKLPIANAVAVSTYNSTKISRGIFISLERVIAQHNVGDLPVAVWNSDCGNNGTVVDDLHLTPVGIGEGVLGDFLAVLGGSKVVRREWHGVSPLLLGCMYATFWYFMQVGFEVDQDMLQWEVNRKTFE